MDKHEVSVANVAVLYVLERPAVTEAIIGARLVVSDHRDGNLLVFEFALGSDDLNRIETVLVNSQDLYHWIGDCGDEYRP